MQTPQKPVPQSARKSSKHLNPKDLPQRSVQSDNDAYLASPQRADQSPSRHKKPKPRKNSTAQRRGGAQSDVGEAGDTRRQRSAHQSTSTKATPAKEAAYAGARFHESPAPSALPLPAFYSRSVPTNSAIDTITERSDSSPDQSRPETHPYRETTPLDFLFDAARKAQHTPNDGSPARFLTPHTGSPASRSPGPRVDDGAFPFELDTSDAEPVQPINNTPFSARLHAIRSPGRDSNGIPEMTEAERLAKTVALKQALMQQSSAPQLTPSGGDKNPFNARNISPMQRLPERQFPDSYSTGQQPAQDGYFAGQTPRHSTHAPALPRNGSGTAVNRPPSSGLRNAYDPYQALNSPPQHSAERRTSVPTARASNFSSIYGNSTIRPQSSEPISHNQTASLDDGLGDLKKMLNLGLADRM